MGIQEDAGLKGDDYSWLGTILYMGVLCGEYPTNFLLQKLPVAKYLAAKYVHTFLAKEPADSAKASFSGEL